MLHLIFFYKKHTWLLLYTLLLNIYLMEHVKIIKGKILWWEHHKKTLENSWFCMYYVYAKQHFLTVDVAVCIHCLCREQNSSLVGGSFSAAASESGIIRTTCVFKYRVVYLSFCYLKQRLSIALTRQRAWKIVCHFRSTGLGTGTAPKSHVN